MNDPKVVWECCTLLSKGGSTLQCSICNKNFHRECLELEPTSDLSQWSCQSCLDKSNKKGQIPNRFKTNVTARSSKRVALDSPPSASNPSLTEESVRTIVQEVIASQMESLLEKFTFNMRALLNQELSVMREDIQCLKNSVAFLSNEYDDIIKENEVTAQKMKALQDENDKLTTSVQVMSTRINNLEHHARANNIEIQCVPQKNNENLVNIVKQLGKVINCDITDENIVNCTRIMKQNNSNNRPKSIVVQFNTPRFRDTVLAASITFNKSKPVTDKLNTSHLGFDGEKSGIYITEHLSPSIKALHAATRLKAKEKGYKYVWIRGGRIYVKKNEGSDNKIVRDIKSLNMLT